MSTPSIYTVALILGRLTHSRVLGLLKKPSYAGTYVFGRYQYVKSVTTDGEVRKNMRAMPAPDWRVHLHDHHEGYITVEEFEQNQQRLACWRRPKIDQVEVRTAFRLAAIPLRREQEHALYQLRAFRSPIARPKTIVDKIDALLGRRARTLGQTHQGSTASGWTERVSWYARRSRLVPSGEAEPSSNRRD